MMTDNSMVDAIIDSMYMNHPEANANEIEFAIVGQYKEGIPWNMGIAQFRNLLTGLSKATNIKPEHTYMLTVAIDNERARLEDLSDIHKFCLKGELPSTAAFDRKIRARDPIDMPEYGLRLRYSNETKLSTESMLAFRDKVKDRERNKFFRHAQRFSIISPRKFGTSGGQIRVDFTTVRQGPGKDFRSAKLTGADATSNDRYEIELEISNFTQEELVKHVEEIKEELGFYLGFLLRNMNGGIAIEPVPDQIVALNKYLALTSNVLEMDSLDPVKDMYLPTLIKLAARFVTVNITTLNMKHIANDANDNSVLMGSGDEQNPIYTFTDKADGQRSLLFIDEEGKTLLLTRNTIKYGSKAEVSPVLTVSPTALTYNVSTGKAKGNTLLDGEYLWIQDRPYFLIFDVLIHDGVNITQTDFSSRINLMAEFNIKNAGVGLNVRAKRFYPYTVSTFNSLLEMQPPVIIRHMDANQLVKLEYRSDDLVYDLDGLVFQPISGPGSYFPLGKGTWHTVFKWKPSYMATLDLLLTYEGQGNPPTVTKTFEATKLEEQSYSLTYATFKAYPNSGARMPTASPYQCLAKMIEGVPRTEPEEGGETGEPIRKGMIVECRLNFQDGEPYWVPVRVRHDKSLPNHIKVYTDLVNTILKEPITLDHLKVKGGGRGGSTRVIVNTVNRNISNRVIVEQVMTRLKDKDGRETKQVSILDLGCGTLKSANAWTDLTKQKRDVTVLGVDVIDVSQANIHLQSYMKKFRSVFRAKFVHGTFNSDFNKQPAVATELAKHGLYNVATCTFAIHYSMATEDTFTTYVRNVARNLSMGGLFIGAYMNKTLMISDMRKNKTTTLGSPKYWLIKVVPPRTLDSAEATTFGAAITITFTELYQDNLEYFISLDDPLVLRIMAQEGLIMREHVPFNQYTEESNRVKADIEKQWLSYHYMFVFQKVSVEEALASLGDVNANAPKPVTPEVSAPPATVATAATAPKKPRIKKAVEKPVAAAVEEKPVAAVVEEKPVAAVVEEKPVAAVVEEKPVAAAVEPKPKPKLTIKAKPAAVKPASASASTSTS